MSILKNRLKEQYTQIPNELILDSTISSGAFRVIAYLYSKPENWQVINSIIMKDLKIKQAQTLANYWKELLKSDWLTRERIKDEEGKMAGGYDYTIQSTLGKIHNMENATLGKIHNTNSNTELSNNTDVKKAQVPIIELDFTKFDDPERAKNFWAKWIDYKKQQFRFRFKGQYEQIAINKLAKLAACNSTTAGAIIGQSVTNGWSGLFPYKNGFQQVIPGNTVKLDDVQLPPETLTEYEDFRKGMINNFANLANVRFFSHSEYLKWKARDPELVGEKWRVCCTERRLNNEILMASLAELNGNNFKRRDYPALYSWLKVDLPKRIYGNN